MIENKSKIKIKRVNIKQEIKDILTEKISYQYFLGWVLSLEDEFLTLNDKLEVIDQNLFEKDDIDVDDEINELTALLKLYIKSHKS